MPANKNALIRYKTIDRCLRNRFRQWTLEDLREACEEALIDMEGITGGVSLRTIQGDLQMMRSDKLGYFAPIEVYDRKYYRYSDPDYSITERPFSENDYEVLEEAVDMLRQLQDFRQFSEFADVVSRLREGLSTSRDKQKPIIHWDRVPGLKGLELLSPLYDYISKKQTLHVVYRPFGADEPLEYDLCPYLLKEYRNRWFLFGARASDLKLYNFPLDRIVSVSPAKEIPFRENPEFDSEHFFDNVIGVSKNIGSYPRDIRFRATREQSAYLITKPIHPSQRILGTNPEDGSTVFKITVVPNFELYSTLLSYGPGIVVEHPKSVVIRLKEMIEELTKMYQ